MSTSNFEEQILKPGYDWAKELNHKILDPDGWRKDDGVTLDTPITLEDYKARYALCTVRLRKAND